MKEAWRRAAEVRVLPGHHQVNDSRS